MNRDGIVGRTQRLGGFCLSRIIRAWMRTLEYRLYCYDPSVDPASDAFRGPVIFVMWHEYLMVPFYLRSRTHLGILASKHRDAEWLSQMAILEGFQVFRGSSGRGGVGAIKAIFAEPSFAGVVLTPDGPRGPRRVMAAGAVFLSSKLKIPLVPVGYGYDRPWRNRRSWDQFPLPYPGSRARIILGPRIQIPQDCSREDLEKYRLSVERTLNILTESAEAWAIDNRPRLHSQICPRDPAPLRD
jgi:lysophospholipid acyltransferase (LPLAT)-like uncharacterized protein